MLTIKPLTRQFKQSDLTQVAFSEKVGVNKGRFSRMMSGQILPNVREINRICSALKCSVQDVIEWEESEDA